jgi:hypothetical protein
MRDEKKNQPVAGAVPDEHVNKAVAAEADQRARQQHVPGQAAQVPITPITSAGAPRQQAHVVGMQVGNAQSQAPLNQNPQPVTAGLAPDAPAPINPRTVQGYLPPNALASAPTPLDPKSNLNADGTLKQPKLPVRSPRDQANQPDATPEDKAAADPGRAPSSQPFGG